MIEEQQWPEHLPDVVEVRQWIVSVLSEHPDVSTATEVINAKGWSVVARFNIENGQQQESVIFKMVALPEFRCAARLFDLLARHCPGDVPHLLAWREDEAGRAWMLFRPFMGPSVQQTGRFDALLDMARTLARIQSTTSTLLSNETANLPRLPASASLTYLNYYSRNCPASTRRSGMPMWAHSAHDLPFPRTS